MAGRSSTADCSLLAGVFPWEGQKSLEVLAGIRGLAQLLAPRSECTGVVLVPVLLPRGFAATAEFSSCSDSTHSTFTLARAALGTFSNPDLAGKGTPTPIPSQRERPPACGSPALLSVCRCLGFLAPF